MTGKLPYLPVITKKTSHQKWIIVTCNLIIIKSCYIFQAKFIKITSITSKYGSVICHLIDSIAPHTQSALFFVNYHELP